MMFRVLAAAAHTAARRRPATARALACFSPPPPSPTPPKQQQQQPTVLSLAPLMAGFGARPLRPARSSGSVRLWQPQGLSGAVPSAVASSPLAALSLRHQRAALFSNMSYRKDDNDDKKRTNSSVEAKGNDKKEPSRWDKLKVMWTEYRYVFLAYYATVWAVPIVPIWAGLESFGLDGVSLLLWLGVDSIYAGVSDWNPSIVNFFIATEINEMFEIVRLPVVISTTPRVAKWWRSRDGRSLKNDGSPSENDSNSTPKQ